MSVLDADRFHREGYHGPFAVLSEEEMRGLEPQLSALLAVPSAAHPGVPATMSRHLDSAVLRDLARRVTVLAPLRSLLGPDLVLWNSYLWNKEPGGAEIPWHQDIDYWPIQPQLTISLWLAVDASDETNSCVHIIPGSHRRSLPHVPVSTKWFTTEAQPGSFDPGEAIAMRLRPGEGFLFTERLLHHSRPNTSQRRRLGISLRYTTPLVRIFHDDPPLFTGHAALMLTGEDRFGWNRYLVEE